MAVGHSATPRPSSEPSVAAAPFEYGWELLQLLVEEAPSSIAKPGVLTNLLRYLLHGRAAHKERACRLLLRVLHLVRLGEPPLDTHLFLALEQQVAWHDGVLRHATQPFEGTSLLPCASQTIINLRT